MSDTRVEHGSLSEALVAALSELTGVEKGRSATVKMKQGGEFSYSYADIADVISTTRPVLARHGLVALTPVHGHDDDLACTVELVHTSGESKEFPPLPFPPGSDAQATGSAITYHRRYALLAALGMAAEDDDGEAAKDRPRAADFRRGRPARGQSSDDRAPTEKQAEFARRLAAKLGDSAVTVVPSIIEEVTGRQAKLADLNRGELSKVIDELKELTDGDAVDQREKVAAAAAATGAEPWPEGQEPFGDD